MHKGPKKFCKQIRELCQSYFSFVDVVDFGSLDINGNNRYLFFDSNYTGVDICEGNNVDVVCKATDYFPKTKVDVVISTEMLEHDPTWDESLVHFMEILRPKGLMLITCATDPRPEHGTKRTNPEDSPMSGDYYRNISPEDITSAFSLKDQFVDHILTIAEKEGTLYFCGIKK